MVGQVCRPSDDEHSIAAWSSVLSSGDVFEAILFGDQRITILTEPEVDRA